MDQLPWYVEAIGLFAGACTTLSFLPQVIKAWRSRSTKDISLAMFVLFAAGVSSWLIYGLLIDSLSVILANAATLILVLAMLAMKRRYG
ncbi:MAG: MtN3 and saliva related transrane protein [Desulfovibrionales bacterium]|jgi:MtN3 and saliva related transmembrane protein|nr:MtN3 and saliva related transrane protein [Desulfovibrionales bacterium]